MVEAEAYMARVLICDDELDVAEIVAELLHREGIDAVTCGSGAEALRLLASDSFDLVVLDIMMPGMDGYQVCRRIRAEHGVPVIFLSAKDGDLAQVLGFKVGADDYVTKPFKPRSLVARIRMHLGRRGVEGGAPQGGALDPSARRVTLHDEVLSLTKTEFNLLHTLMAAGGDVVDARTLYRRVWHGEPNAQSRNSVMVYIRHLRRKLAQIDPARTFIYTVWGVGYRMAGMRRTGLRDVMTDGDAAQAGQLGGEMSDGVTTGDGMTTGDGVTRGDGMTRRETSGNESKEAGRDDRRA